MLDSNSYDVHRAANRNTTPGNPIKTQEIGARWLKTISDIPNRFTSRLQQFSSNNYSVKESSSSTNTGYIFAIVSENLHGQFKPAIITKTYNGARNMEFVSDLVLNQLA